MNPKDRELMERYIYQVTRRLPREQRNEVGLELQELIGDMMDVSGSMEEVLTKLGSPADFAKRYQDTSHYLIGPEYYDNYLWFLKIVLLCTLIPVLAVGIIEGIQEAAAMAGGDNINRIVHALIYGITNTVTNGIISCMGAFGGVTIMFAIMERQKIKFDLRKEKEWTINDLGDNFASQKSGWTPRYLAPVPHKKALISRGDSIVGIVFIVIFCVLLIFAPQFFSGIFRDGKIKAIVPVFNLDKWNMILPVFITGLLIGLADEVVRLVMGCYCKIVMISSIVCGILQVILSILLLKVFPFWNPDFAAEIKTQLGEQLHWGTKFLSKWDGAAASNIILALIIAITILEITFTIYKTLRYGVNEHTNQ
ncbi:hypothetical protein NXH76_18695 [Blautia schinkii]|nr:hypothetical protein [Blautia schinkii]